MSEMVKFEFSQFQSVKIKAIEAKGFVGSRMNNSHGVNEYKVSYWLDASPKQEWFYEFELEAA